MLLFLRLRALAHHDGEMAERLDDAGRAAATAGLETLHDEALADRGFGHDQPVDVEIVVVLGIGDRRVERLLDVQRDALLREGELVDGQRRLLAANGGGHEVELARADAHGAQHGLGLIVRLAAGSGGLAHVDSLDTLLSPEWDEKVRVGANSPSLCPTISSVTFTGMNFLPL